MAVELRPYQEQARAAVWAQWDGGARRTLLVMPTGCGKTVVFAKVIADVSRKGGRALVLAHRGELLQQAADKLSAATGLGAAVEKAQESCIGSFFSAVVGSVQTLCRPERLEQFGHGYFDAIIVDEAHHVLAESYQRVLAHFPAAKVLGVTATADRGDKRDLGQYFESMAYEYSLHEAIRDGYLCPIKAQTVPLELDISGVGVSAGDFKAAELGNALGPYLHRIADEMAAAGCLGRKTVAFLPLVATSQHFARILASKGFGAMEANGASRDRAEVLQAFANAGPGAVLCNSMLVTEGWDQPDVDCIVVLRPTKVRSLYAQMVGRGTRTSPGKEHLLILDFLWHTDRHELVRPASLVCQSAEVAARMTADVQAAGGPVDISEAEQAAAKAVVEEHERERSLRRQLEEVRGRRGSLVDPVQYAYSIQAEDLAGYAPSFGWEMAPASEAQLAALERAGIDAQGVGCAGLASKLLDRLAARRTAGLATPKQVRQLERRGFLHVGTWGFAEANALIGRIAANSWRVPASIDPATYVPPCVQPGAGEGAWAAQAS